MDVSLSELREMVMDREALSAAVRGVTESQTELRDWSDLIWSDLIMFCVTAMCEAIVQGKEHILVNKTEKFFSSVELTF